ncbi:MAG TPA: hypothetical protein VN366_11060 [Feifaniaceae bacterium]|nr:hypothetical protein [Feifaniaceae bacterium]
MNRRLNPSKQLTLGAMVTALTVLSLYAVAVLPVGSVPLYFLASFFMYILACEGAYAAALLSFLASAALSFFLLPEKSPVLFYAALLGHYGIFRTALQGRVENKFLLMLIKLLYCDVFAGAGLYIGLYVWGGLDIALPETLPVWAVVVLSQAALLVYDILYALSASIYEARFRKSIVPRR